MEPESRVTLGDLVAAAADERAPASERLVKDWVSKGLLDRATEVGLGRAAGFDRTWPTIQRTLLLHLLQLRQSGRGLRSLANVPVSLWLAHGPAAVPIRQARRALATWVIPTGQPSLRASGVVAREIVARLQPDDAARKQRWRELTDLVAAALHRDTVDAQRSEPRHSALDREAAKNLLDRIIQADKRVWLGAAPEYNAHLLELQLSAMASIVHARTLDNRGMPRSDYVAWLDERLERARQLSLLNNAATVEREGNRMIVTPRVFEQDACLRLLPNLGMDFRHPA